MGQQLAQELALEPLFTLRWWLTVAKSEARTVRVATHPGAAICGLAFSRALNLHSAGKSLASAMPRTASTLPRDMAPRLRDALRDSPAVLIHGARQSGKATLARAVGEPLGYRYVTFDDEAICSAARGDPIGFVSTLPPRIVLDEVQRMPEIFTSLKAAIDQGRTAGRFLLTGSANSLSRTNATTPHRLARLHPGQASFDLDELALDLGELAHDR